MNRLSASFRDPSGFVFSHNGIIHRQVNSRYAAEYEQLIASGLYEALTQKQWLIRHEEVQEPSVSPEPDAYKLLRPEQIPYISYPYEWCFSQLKDAALLTLKIAAKALQHDMMLKDASAYNVQFLGSQPLFIDTLSFAPYVEGEPWIAYRQFCQHFLAPLALMAYVDISVAKLLVTQIDGIPLATASRLLPLKTRLKSGLYSHLHLHAKTQQRFADSAEETNTRALENRKPRISKKALRAILESLAVTINNLKWHPPKTEWGEYYAQTNYSPGAADDKANLLRQLIGSIASPLETIHDLGANTGVYSEVAAAHCRYLVSQDIDPIAVEAQYQKRRAAGPKNILPLLQDVTAPSPAIGWRNAERDAFTKRAHCDAVLALALVHHLAITNNTPLGDIAAFFADLAPYLIIEFVPKSDSQVKRLLATREDIFPDYTEAGFERIFGALFTVERKQGVAGSDRTLYLMKRRVDADSGGSMP